MFINRNADMFEYVLDYLRNGGVLRNLPTDEAELAKVRTEYVRMAHAFLRCARAVLTRFCSSDADVANRHCPELGNAAFVSQSSAFKGTGMVPRLVSFTLHGEPSPFLW